MIPADFSVRLIIHDFHGCWSHHPHRTIQAAVCTWKTLSCVELDTRLLTQTMFTCGTLQERVARLATLARVSADNMWEVFEGLYDQIYIPNLGLRATVRELAALGIAQIVVTNGPLDAVTEVVHAWGLASYILKIFGHAPGEERLKLNGNLAHLVNTSLHGLQVYPEQCLVVGDYEGDVAAAHRSGMKSALLVTSHYRAFYPARASKKDSPLAPPKYVLFSLPELLDVVLGNDLSWDQRRHDLVHVGVQTRTTKIWL